MDLKKQDIVVLLKLLVQKNRNWTYNSISYELDLSVSQVHAAINRCLKARLLCAYSAKPEPILANIKEFIEHALKYLCIPKNGEITRGMPTSWAASPLKKHFRSQELPPVWPDPEGNVRGYSFEPIHKSAIHAAKTDPALYEYLVLLDAIRSGRAREKTIALDIFKKQLDLISQSNE